MPIGAILGTAYGIGKTLGIDFDFGGDFTASDQGGLIETIAYFERISRSEAQQIAGDVVRKIKAGQNNAQIKRYVEVSGGYQAGGFRGNKWKFVAQEINKIRMSIRQSGGTAAAMATGTMLRSGFGSWGAIILLIGIVVTAIAAFNDQ